MTAYVGLNIGYGWTKAVHNTRSVLFESQIAPAVTVQYHADLLTNGHDLEIELEGQRWLVGEWARLHSRELISPRSRERDPVMTRALAGAALHRLGLDGAEPVKLVTGLPVRWFRQDQDTFKKLLKGAQRLTVNGTPVTYQIEDVIVMPEAYGTLYRVLLDANGVLVDKGNIRDQKVAILDIGTYTTNLVLVDQTRYIEYGSRSETVGMAAAYELIQRKLAELPDGREVDFREAEQIARTWKLQVRGEERDVQVIVADALISIVRTILSHVSTLWGGGADLTVVLVTGGGGEILLPYIQQRYAHARLVTDAQMANAEGFYRYALLKFGGQL